MLKWLIIFCCYEGELQEPDGQIILTPDSVIAFNVKWEVTGYKVSTSVKETIYQGDFYLKNGDLTAELRIRMQKVWFIIPGEESATMYQEGHSNEVQQESTQNRKK